MLADDYIFSAELAGPSGFAPAVAVSWHELGHLVSRAIRDGKGANFSVLVRLAEPVGAYGEHGMADGGSVGVGGDGGTGAVGLAVPGPNAAGKSKERVADCSCGIGLGTTFSAHYPGCSGLPVFSRGGVVVFDGETEQGRPLVLDGPQEVWKGADVSDQHTICPAPIEAGDSANGPPAGNG